MVGWISRELRRIGWRKAVIIGVAIIVVVVLAYGNNADLMNGGN